MGLMIGGAILVGWALLKARADADSGPIRRDYDDGKGWRTLNKPNCDHNGSDIDEINGRVYCMDCGQHLPWLDND